MNQIGPKIRRLGRFLKAILKHPRVPKWMKYGLGVLLIIPGPVDELLASVVLVGLAVWKWEIICECWHSSETDPKRVAR